MSLVSILLAPGALDGQLVASLTAPEHDSVRVDVFHCQTQEMVALLHAYAIHSGDEMAVLPNDLSELDFTEPAQDVRFIQRRRRHPLSVIQLACIRRQGHVC